MPAKKDLKFLKKRLLEKKSELIEVVQKAQNYGREANSSAEAMDIVDQASSSYTKEFMFSKSNSDRQLLQAVVDALDRIEDGNFGDCANCGNPVQRKRLEAVPWASLCLQCQEQAETTG